MKGLMQTVELQQKYERLDNFLKDRLKDVYPEPVNNSQYIGSGVEACSAP